MEERVSSLKLKHDNDHQPPPLPILTPTPSPPLSPFHPICVKHEHAGDPIGETYVVRVPKVQIYRVPPPENAIIADRFRNPENNKSKHSNSIFLNKRFLLGLGVVLIIGILALVISLAARPNTPTFSVDHVLVNHKRLPEYHITLQSDNLNNGVTILYEKGGSASLAFKNREIATGKTPTLQEKKDDEKRFEVVLAGKAGKLPSEIEESLKEEGKATKKIKNKIALSLTASIPAKMKLGMVKDISVECEMEVNTLSQGTRVLHQKCNAKI